jgi:hypothetical protein
MKDVLGENGHEAEICQRSMEIDAADKLLASDLAKVRFCENESVKEWSLHAKVIEEIELRATFMLRVQRKTVAANLRLAPDDSHLNPH